MVHRHIAVYVVATEISYTRFSVSSGNLLGVVVGQTKWDMFHTMYVVIY